MRQMAKRRGEEGGEWADGGGIERWRGEVDIEVRVSKYQVVKDSPGSPRVRWTLVMVGAHLDVMMVGTSLPRCWRTARTVERRERRIVDS